MDKVETSYDSSINTYIVRFPAQISLPALMDWSNTFNAQLTTRNEKAGLLFDTNRHDFESIECLKWLKTYLTENPVILSHIDRAAFIQPEEYRSPTIISDAEAYFTSFDDALVWLQR